MAIYNTSYGIYYEASDNADKTRYCVFPSGTLENDKNGYYANPYFGKYDCAASPTIKSLNLKKYQCLCNSNYDYWVSAADQGEAPFCFYPRLRCIFNTDRASLESPWKNLPQKPSGSIYAGNYFHHKYSSYVNDFCYFSFCDPVIYVNFGDENPELNMRFGGYYVIEPNDDQKKIT